MRQMYKFLVNSIQFLVMIQVVKILIKGVFHFKGRRATRSIIYKMITKTNKLVLKITKRTFRIVYKDIKKFYIFINKQREKNYKKNYHQQLQNAKKAVNDNPNVIDLRDYVVKQNSTLKRKRS